MRLRLVKLAIKYQRHLNDMMEEWYATGEKNRKQCVGYKVKGIIGLVR